MRKEPEKYVKGGALSPFWVEWDMERYRRENPDEYCYSSTNVTISTEGCNDIHYGDKLEARFQFLKKHSNSEEDLKLAKQILGIDIDD